jgi:hypothetical protein
MAIAGGTGALPDRLAATGVEQRENVARIGFPEE